jgi:hypothetical protein
VEDRLTDIDSLVSWPGLVGYLNFSRGKADARFQKQINDAFDWLERRGVKAPWQALSELLRSRLPALKSSKTPGFEDISQASAVIDLAFEHVLPAYREHHRDLLFHQPDKDLYRPFFLARVFEAVLAEGGPWTQTQRIVKRTLVRLNDFVGYRPLAILETRPRGEPYPHERVAVVPLYIRGAGVAAGRYREVLTRALALIETTDPALLQEAGLDPNLLDEIAVDPRAYDHGHPVNRRPNYVFGEWDPHQLDDQGRFRRYIIRQASLDALMERYEKPLGHPREEMLAEAAAVLAGTMLMGAAITGSSPTARDSTETLSALMPRIAQLRDQFYEQLLARLSGPHAERLQREIQQTRQPFGAARQHLNQRLAQDRAAQLQQRFLSLLFAEMGYPDASRDEATHIPAPSVRVLSDIFSRLTTGSMIIERRERGEGRKTEEKPAETTDAPPTLAAAAKLLPEVEDLLRRGIECGALVDPWNILGFQALFPLSPAQEDAIRDTRVDELLQVVAYHLSLYARLMGEAAAEGVRELVKSLSTSLRHFASWWDRFASVEVADVRRVHAGEALESAEHVALALGHWHERGEATADLGFWKNHLDQFHSPKAFALVVDALLRKEDYRASMALLMNWLGQAEQVPLEDGEHSFNTLAMRWMLAWTSRASQAPDPARWDLIRKFFDYLEANAEEYWQVSTLDLPMATLVEDPDDNLYSAAYENVTYQDTTDDDEDAMVAGATPHEDFDLEEMSENIEQRLRFLGTVARLWLIAARCDTGETAGTAEASPLGLEERQKLLKTWLKQAQANQPRLLDLIQAIHGCSVPDPSGSFDSVVEYDRRRAIKEQLLYTGINTCLETALAIGAVQGAMGRVDEAEAPAGWEPYAIRIEQAILAGDAGAVRSLLPAFFQEFRHEPLIFTSLSSGGEPKEILRVRIAQTLLRALAVSLPRLGLIRETYELVKTAHAMEQANKITGRGVTEFNFLFQAAFQSVVEAVVLSSEGWPPHDAETLRLVEVLERITTPFLTLWIQHSNSLQLAALEGLRNDRDWQALGQFVQRYGGDLFQARFMALGNLRGIVHRGAGAYLDYLRDNPDPLHPVRLIEDIERGKIDRNEADRHLTIVMQAIIENYEEYKDYKSTATQSDYGENLHMLLDFLRLKATYERQAWHYKPLVFAHEVLVRRNKLGVAIQWEENFTRIARERSLVLIAELGRLEQTHGLRLRTVSDHLQERFVKPLSHDRMCALIEPAMEEARRTGARQAFDRLRAELRVQSETPTGVGLDVPEWLRRLEQEVRRVHAIHSNVAVLAENLFRIPAVKLTYEEMQGQLGDWDKNEKTGSA